MNNVEISGNLARDPVVRSTKTGRAVAKDGWEVEEIRG